MCHTANLPQACPHNALHFASIYVHCMYTNKLLHIHLLNTSITFRYLTCVKKKAANLCHQQRWIHSFIPKGKSCKTMINFEMFV